jgi:hypothetical protein
LPLDFAAVFFLPDPFPLEVAFIPLEVSDCPYSVSGLAFELAFELVLRARDLLVAMVLILWVTSPTRRGSQIWFRGVNQV